MSKVILTGFTPFGDLAVNPSELVVKRIAERASSLGLDGLVTEVLQTEFAAAGARIVEMIRMHNPHLVLMVGVSEGLKAISLERVALNLDDAESPDNAGESRIGKLILPDGPKAYWSTLPLERINAELEARGIPVVISNHAGTYVCNHVFYLARHQVEQSDSQTYCGFVHIPLISEASKTRDNQTKGLPLEVMVAAIEGIIGVIQREFSMTSPILISPTRRTDVE